MKKWIISQIRSENLKIEDTLFTSELYHFSDAATFYTFCHTSTVSGIRRLGPFYKSLKLRSSSVSSAIFGGSYAQVPVQSRSSWLRWCDVGPRWSRRREESSQLRSHVMVPLCERLVPPCVDIVKTDTYSEQLSSCSHHGGAAPPAPKVPPPNFLFFGLWWTSDLKPEPFLSNPSSVRQQVGDGGVAVRVPVDGHERREGAGEHREHKLPRGGGRCRRRAYWVRGEQGRDKWRGETEYEHRLRVAYR